MRLAGIQKGHAKDLEEESKNVPLSYRSSQNLND